MVCIIQNSFLLRQICAVKAIIININYAGDSLIGNRCATHAMMLLLCVHDIFANKYIH